VLVRALLLALLALLVCAPVAAAQSANANPVLAGEWPDPTVVRTDQGYFASATSGNWAPIFRILWSGDLRSWKVKGEVFRKRPRWASHDFWAPEFVEHAGRWLVFYNARRKGAPATEGADEPPQCIGVATAARITGPYRDSGAPVYCNSVGAIDPFAARDENGRLTLLWKEDGNSAGLPTRILGQPLSEDGTRLLSGTTPTQLFANDPASWEGSVVEAPTIVRRNGFFYMLYAGNLCCGPPCTYAEGVARSRKLLGSYRRRPGNPILTGNPSLKCPGHGSVVSDVTTGRDSFLYHAYRTGPHFFVGRQLILDDVNWGSDGFPTLGSGSPSFSEPAPRGLSFFEPFRGRRLKPEWEWRAVAKPLIAVRRGRLALRRMRARRKDLAAAVLTRRPTSGVYTATAKIRRSKLRRGVYAGLAAFRSRTHSLLVAISRDTAVVVQRDPDEGQRRLAKIRLPESRLGFLRIRARGDRFAFFASRDGRRWRRLDGSQTGNFEGSVRIALTAGGGTRPRAEFESFGFRARR